MREARHDGVGVGVGKIEQRALRRPQQIDDIVDRRAQIQPDIGGDLVVARARGVQALAGIAYERGEALLDVEVDVFGIERPRECTGADFIAHLAETLLNRGKIVGVDNAAGIEHARVRERTVDVEFGEAAVEIDRSGEAFDEFGDRFAEASRPQRCVFCFLLRHLSCSHIIKR